MAMILKLFTMTTKKRVKCTAKPKWCRLFSSVRNANTMRMLHKATLLTNIPIYKCRDISVMQSVVNSQKVRIHFAINYMWKHWTWRLAERQNSSWCSITEYNATVLLLAIKKISMRGDFRTVKQMCTCWTSLLLRICNYLCYNSRHNKVEISSIKTIDVGHHLVLMNITQEIKINGYDIVGTAHVKSGASQPQFSRLHMLSNSWINTFPQQRS
jgi:hypothetical protein